MKRIMIIGASGSGKSTLARALGAQLALPVVHGDHFYFDPGWQKKPADEVMRLFNDASSQDRWVLDGNHGKSMEARAARSDAIIYMELGKWHRLRRTLWRTVRSFGKQRLDSADGCLENFNPSFHFDWVLGFDQRQKPKMDWFVDEWRDHKPVVILSSRNAVTRFLQNPLQGIEDVRPF